MNDAAAQVLLIMTCFIVIISTITLNRRKNDVVVITTFVVVVGGGGGGGGGGRRNHLHGKTIFLPKHQASVQKTPLLPRGKIGSKQKSDTHGKAACKPMVVYLRANVHR